MRVEKLGGLVARLHAHPRRRLTLLVGVDGPPGSGKTTLARALASLDPGIERVELEEFRFGAGKVPVDEMLLQRYQDADVQTVAAVIPLERAYGKPSWGWRPWAFGGAAGVAFGWLPRIRLSAIRSSGISSDWKLARRSFLKYTTRRRC